MGLGQPSGPPASARQVNELLVRQVPPELLAAELQRQGWIVMAP